jgi:hypothetical protein
MNILMELTCLIGLVIVWILGGENAPQQYGYVFVVQMTEKCASNE